MLIGRDQLLKYVSFKNKVERKKVEEEVEIKHCKLARGCKVYSHNNKFQEKSEIEGRLRRSLKFP